MLSEIVLDTLRLIDFLNKIQNLGKENKTVKILNTCVHILNVFHIFY